MIDVQAPNGASVSFPDGTDADTIHSVMLQHFGGQGATPESPQPAAQAEPWAGPYQPENLVDFIGHLPREIGDLAHAAATPAIRQQAWDALTGANGQPRAQLGPERLVRNVNALVPDILSGRLPTPNVNDPTGANYDRYLQRVQEGAAFMMPGWAPKGALASGLGGDLEHLAQERLALPAPERSPGDGMAGAVPPPGAAAGGAGRPPPPPPPGGGMGGGSALPPGGRGQAMVESLSPEARAMANEALERGGVTPANVEQLNADAHPETLLAELTPSLQGEVSGGIVNEPGAGKNVFSQALDARQSATPARHEQLLTDVFGERPDIAQRVKDLEAAQANKSAPAYEEYRRKLLPPMPDDLLARVDSPLIGAARYAESRMDAKGLPAKQTAGEAPAAAGLTLWDQGLRSGSGPGAPGAPGALATGVAPVPRWTAQAVDFMKQRVDALIQKALNQGGQAGWVHDLGEIKTDLVAWADKASNGTYKTARETWAAPQKVLDAQALGNKFFNARMSIGELQGRLAGATGAEQQGFMAGLRDAASHTLRGSVRGDSKLRNIVSSPEAKDKIAWAVGQERADWFAKAIEHEAEFPKAKQAIIAGSQTAPRIEAAKYWTPQPSSVNETIGKVMHGAGPGVAIAAHLAGLEPTTAAVLGAGAGALNFVRNKAALKQFEQLRNEVAPIFALKGSDRAGALRALLPGPPPPPGPRAPGSLSSAARNWPALPQGASIIEHGPHGPAVDGLQDRWPETVQWLHAAQSGEARGVLSHPDVPGRIDVVWGDKGRGLQHIMEKHPEVVGDLPERLARMRQVQANKSQIVLATPDGNERAAVRLDFDGGKKNWLLTAYDRREGRKR